MFGRVHSSRRGPNKEHSTTLQICPPQHNSSPITKTVGGGHIVSPDSLSLR
jgi:hypothetical protein